MHSTDMFILKIFQLSRIASEAYLMLSLFRATINSCVLLSLIWYVTREVVSFIADSLPESNKHYLQFNAAFLASLDYLMDLKGVNDETQAAYDQLIIDEFYV